MEKERRIKTISVIALIVAVLGLTVAFAVLSANLVINGTAKVDPGKWDIHFEDLSEAKTKGGALVEGAATINDENKTKIEGINVTLTKPMDEVTYTVELKNDGDIDAEISSITGPNFGDDVKEYIEFSATYDDNKPITVGDILRGKTKEDVTISLKFKKEVTQLPNEDLTVNLSYQINYIQTDKKDEEVHKGQASTPQIDYNNLKQGNEVTLGTEGFYVIENNDTELKLLAKYNLLVGNTVTLNGEIIDIEELNPQDLKIEPIDEKTIGYGRQSPDAKGAVSNETKWIGTIEFAKKTNGSDYGYWADESGNYLPQYEEEQTHVYNVYNEQSSLHKYIQNYKSYLENDLKYNIKDARLIKIEELMSVMESGSGSDISKYAPDWVYSTTYWLPCGFEDRVNIIFSEGSLGDPEFYNNYFCGIRPLIVIDKTE